MFEHSLYDPEPVAEPLRQGDLFHNYEVTNWDFSPRLYKILAVAGAVNVLGLLVFAQTSLLTMKGCDSPLVARVCQVLDTVYVGSKLFGTDRDYVDAVYDKTELGDAEITFVDVSGVTPPLSYPEGYFALANPVEFQAMLDAQNNTFVDDLAGFPSNFPTTTPYTGGSITDTQPNLPPANNNVIQGELPSFGSGKSSTTTPPFRRSRRNRIPVPPKGDVVDDLAEDVTPGKGNGKNPKDDAVAEKTPEPEKKIDPTAPIDTYDINKRPFVDLANNVNALLEKKQVKLDTAFVVSGQGRLTKEGKLDPKSFRWGQVASTDQKMIDVVKSAVEAINDSGYLQYLSELSGKDFSLVIKQDETSISAVIQSELESEAKAKTISSGLNFVIGVVKSRKSGEGADQNDKDDLELLKNAKVEFAGKKVVLNFNVPKQLALLMIQRKLDEQKAQLKQPSGIAPARSGDNTAQN
ncbi:MAG: hypothetical protein WKF34_11705 [Pyrinomonadaceae bacterium]